jgi:hypothetical protein
LEFANSLIGIRDRLFMSRHDINSLLQLCTTSSARSSSRSPADLAVARKNSSLFTHHHPHRRLNIWAPPVAQGTQPVDLKSADLLSDASTRAGSSGPRQPLKPGSTASTSSSIFGLFFYRVTAIFVGKQTGDKQ